MQGDNGGIDLENSRADGTAGKSPAREISATSIGNPAAFRPDRQDNSAAIVGHHLGQAPIAGRIGNEKKAIGGGKRRDKSLR